MPSLPSRRSVGRTPFSVEGALFAPVPDCTCTTHTHTHTHTHHITSHRLTHTHTQAHTCTSPSHAHTHVAMWSSLSHLLMLPCAHRYHYILGTADPSKLGNLFFWGQTVYSSPRTTTPPAAVRGTRAFHGTSVNMSRIASCCTVPIHTTYISRERGTHARMHARSHTYIHMHTHAHAHASVSECCARESNTHVLMSS
jgi:hypothetical protein